MSAPQELGGYFWRIGSKETLDSGTGWSSLYPAALLTLEWCREESTLDRRCRLRTPTPCCAWPPAGHAAICQALGLPSSFRTPLPNFSGQLKITRLCEQGFLPPSSCPPFFHSNRISLPETRPCRIWAFASHLATRGGQNRF